MVVVLVSTSAFEVPYKTALHKIHCYYIRQIKPTQLMARAYTTIYSYSYVLTYESTAADSCRLATTINLTSICINLL